ncbi:MAG: MBL fold metallo-hydrolase [Ruminococcus sp.]|nr:MBL fold metallo-hydrolase [Ruminococcus sp.]
MLLPCKGPNSLLIFLLIYDTIILNHSVQRRLFMTIRTLQLGELAANCHIIDCGNGICAAVDIGNDPDRLLSWLEEQKYTLCAILLTHGHYDHIGGVEAVREATGAPVYIHEADAPMLQDASRNLAAHITMAPYRNVKEYVIVRDGDEITAGERVFRVLHTPGHTSGSCCFLTDDILLSGDTLFRGSMGRTDLGGNPAEMRRSLKQLASIEEDLRVYSGHGDQTTLNYEKKTNPYLRSL